SKARKELDWETQYSLALDPERARARHSENKAADEHGACTMCGEFCAVKIMDERREYNEQK
ncbi:MAG: phosphomethylpyrimidine synthase ThiC, partial [Desulfuromonadaceae bacterium]